MMLITVMMIMTSTMDVDYDADNGIDKIDANVVGVSPNSSDTVLVPTQKHTDMSGTNRVVSRRRNVPSDVLLPLQISRRSILAKPHQVSGQSWFLLNLGCHLES
jgi:hypothetical protein